MQDKELDALKKYKKSPKVNLLYYALIALTKKVLYPQKNFMLSHPKAGRTWLQAAMSIAVSEEYQLSENYYFYGERQLSLKLPYLTFTHGNSKLIAKGENLDQFNNSSVIFLTRNLLDLQVSYYHQMSKRRGQFNGSLSEFIKDDEFGIKKVIEYHNQVNLAKSTFKSYLHISYEDMHEDLHNVLTKCFEFLKLNISDESIDKAVKFSQFSNMKKRESSEILHPHLASTDTSNPDASKVRKGKVNSFHEEMSSNDIDYCQEMVRTHLSEFS